MSGESLFMVKHCMNLLLAVISDRKSGTYSACRLGLFMVHVSNNGHTKCLHIAIVSHCLILPHQECMFWWGLVVCLQRELKRHCLTRRVGKTSVFFLV